MNEAIALEYLKNKYSTDNIDGFYFVMKSIQLDDGPLDIQLFVTLASNDLTNTKNFKIMGSLMDKSQIPESKFAGLLNHIGDVSPCGLIEFGDKYAIQMGARINNLTPDEIDWMLEIVARTQVSIYSFLLEKRVNVQSEKKEEIKSDPIVPNSVVITEFEQYINQNIEDDSEFYQQTKEQLDELNEQKTHLVSAKSILEDGRGPTPILKWMKQKPELEHKASLLPKVEAQIKELENSINSRAVTPKWKILNFDKDNNKALILSEQIVNVLSYNINGEEETWETSSLRKWLNSEYRNTLPMHIEERIIETRIINSNNSKYGAQGGNDTTDGIFLLSIDEVEDYFRNDIERIAKYKERNIEWWLRSPGRGNAFAATVNDGDGFMYEITGEDDYKPGKINYGGILLGKVVGGAPGSIKAGVRPAMWLSTLNL